MSRVETATTQQEVSSALPLPPAGGSPNLVWGVRGLKEKQGVALPRVSTGGRQSSCRPGGQGESRDSALQQRALEEAFFGARLGDLDGSASSLWAVVILLGGERGENESQSVAVGPV